MLGQIGAVLALKVAALFALVSKRQGSGAAKPVSNTMNTAKSIIVVLFLLLTAQIASAYYCPSTGRWLSRDPIGEPGFENLRASSVVSLSARWIKRDPILGLLSEAKSKATTKILPNQNTINLYAFVGNDPVISVDGLGLDPCGSASPQPANSCVCDRYGNRTYSNDPGLQVGLKCFCKCAGDSPWSQAVRGCLACEDAKGTDITVAHAYCYLMASLHHVMPLPTIERCFTQCGGDWSKFISSLSPPVIAM